jgi:hypothetical protein
MDRDTLDFNHGFNHAGLRLSPTRKFRDRVGKRGTMGNPRGGVNPAGFEKVDDVRVKSPGRAFRLPVGVRPAFELLREKPDRSPSRSRSCLRREQAFCSHELLTWQRVRGSNPYFSLERAVS